MCEIQGSCKIFFISAYLQGFLINKLFGPKGIVGELYLPILLFPNRDHGGYVYG